MVVQLGISLVVPAVEGVVVKALELVPHHVVLHVRVAFGHARRERREVAEVLAAGRVLKARPIGTAGDAALHPGRIGDGESRTAPEPARGCRLPTPSGPGPAGAIGGRPGSGRPRAPAGHRG